MSADMTPPDLWPYTERSASTAARDAEVLFAEPEISLSDEERRQVGQFAHELMTGIAGDDRVTLPGAGPDDTPPTLRSVCNMIELSRAHSFARGYIESPRVTAVLGRIGLDRDPAKDSLQQAADLISETGKLNNSVATRLAAKSARWETKQYAEQLGEPPETDADFADIETFSVNTEPDKLLDKLEALKAYKSFYLCLRRAESAAGMPDVADAVVAAKRAQLDLYLAKVNSQLALLYPRALSLAGQLEAGTANDRSEQWRTRLTAAAPVLKYAFSDVRNSPDGLDSYEANFLRRLDLVRNGAAIDETGQSGGDYVPVSPEMLAFVSSIEPTTEEIRLHDGYSADDLDAMKNQVWKAPQFKVFVEAVLDAQGLLSSEQDTWEDVAERTGPAVDGRWQAVIFPDHTSLETLGKKKVMAIPEAYEKPVLQVSPSGSLTLVAHEDVHVLQNEADAEHAEEHPLGGLTGPRHLLLKEMGGIREERAVLAELGLERPVKPMYIQGQQVKLAGGNRAEVNRAGYNPPADNADTAKIDKARTSAVNQAKRLYRHGGYNSQPLDYLEQAMIADILGDAEEQQVRALTTAASKFALAHSAELHRVGLFELPDASALPSPAQTVLRVYNEKFREH